MKNVVSILKSVGAIVTDSHFVGTSGRHMPAYINKDALLLHPKQTSEVGKLFAQKFKNKNIEVVGFEIFHQKANGKKSGEKSHE